MAMKNNVTIENKQASYNYFIEDTLECGIELRGNEVKSLRAGMASIKESWIDIENGDLIIKKMHITPWDTANAFDVDETRTRKLLAHKKEVRDLGSKLQLEGYTLVPLKVYFKDGKRCKVLVGLARGKHTYDKRNTIKERQVKRDIDRTLKGVR